MKSNLRIDVSAHNYLIDVDLKDINHQLPY